MANFSNKCRQDPTLRIGQKVLVKEVEIQQRIYSSIEAIIIAFDAHIDGINYSVLLCPENKETDNICSWSVEDMNLHYKHSSGFELVCERTKNLKDRKVFWADPRKIIPLDSLERILLTLEKELK